MHLENAIQCVILGGTKRASACNMRLGGLLMDLCIIQHEELLRKLVDGIMAAWGQLSEPPSWWWMNRDEPIVVFR